MKRIKDSELFIERFREARKDMTLECIAIETGISRGMIRHYSAGVKLPGDNHLTKIAKVLKVSPEWLAGETIFKTPIEESVSKFNTPDRKAGAAAINLIYQAIEQLAAVHGYDLGMVPDVEIDGGLGYDGKGIAMHLAAIFENELEKQCDKHLLKK